MPEPQTRAAAAAARLTATADEILAEVQQLPPELIHWVPAAGVWTVMDNLCHIREFVPFWTGETLRIVKRPAEPWGRDHTDTARLAAVTNTAAHTLQDVVSDIREAVRRSAETLKVLSEQDLAVEAIEQEPSLGREAGLIRDRRAAGASRREAPGPDPPQHGAVRPGTTGVRPCRSKRAAGAPAGAARLRQAGEVSPKREARRRKRGTGDPASRLRGFGRYGAQGDGDGGSGGAKPPGQK